MEADSTRPTYRLSILRASSSLARRLRRQTRVDRQSLKPHFELCRAEPLGAQPRGGVGGAWLRSGGSFCICSPTLPSMRRPLVFSPLEGGARRQPLYNPRELGRQLTEPDRRKLLTMSPFVNVAREATARTGCDLCVLGEVEAAISFSALLGGLPAITEVNRIETAGCRWCQHGSIGSGTGGGSSRR